MNKDPGNWIFLVGYSKSGEGGGDEYFIFLSTICYFEFIMLKLLILVSIISTDHLNKSDI